MCAGIAHLRHFAKSLFAHEAEVYRDVERHEALVGTDVGGCLLATYVLLASLQRQDESPLAAIVKGLSHDTSRQLSHQLLRAGHVAHARASEGHGNAEALAFAYSHVGSPLGWRLQDSQVAGVGVHYEDALLLVDGVGNACVVLDDAVVVGLLHDESCHAALSKFLVESLAVEDTIGGRHELDGEAVEVCVGLDDAAHLWVHRLAHQDAVCLLGVAPSHHGSLRRSGSAVVHRGVGNVHARQLCNHRLILEDVVKRALRYFGLIRRIGRQELRALDEVLHYAGRIVIVASCTGKANELLCALRCSQLFEEESQVGLRESLRQFVVSLEARSLRNVGKEVVNRLRTGSLQHLLQVLLGVGKILVHDVITYSIIRYDVIT